MSINARKGHQGFCRLPFGERFWSKVDKRGESECWLWTGCKDAGGYGQFTIAGRGPNRGKRAHRIAWELHHARPFPEGMLACHSCDNPSCVNPAHIWPGTFRDNARDAYEKGRIKPRPPRKLDARKVREIRLMRSNGISQIEVARRFAVTPGTIRRIEHGETWGDVA